MGCELRIGGAWARANLLCTPSEFNPSQWRRAQEMFLGHEEIWERIKRQRLVENYHPQALQGAGIDFRIDRLLKVESGSLLGREDRRLPELRSSELSLSPGGYYLLVTMERLNMPGDLIGFVLNRSSLFRCGASLKTAVIDPGYKGELTVGIKNETVHEIALERGARVLQVVFAEVKGKTRSYSGRYQGGRVV